ncbi:hypothetical protein BJ875DRAFT_506323 [Amylocarpus encephaloides]|uniref:Peptidase A1 domain-containing protein n=1 Tax=Amylocarpus encephaloides TaxID=45428 RepID=A0A9P8C3D3_9HELO|nr:hypothetical protein BJ875DRAFT_506323 [Amylocarpus encephaloides]
MFGIIAYGEIWLNVRCLPGTSSTSTLVAIPQSCQPRLADCANLRGGLFSSNASSTWSDIGIYNLGFENSLGYEDNGKFGVDTVGLGYQGSGNLTINHKILDGVAGSNFLLGVLGLNPQPTNFTDLNDSQPGLLNLLKPANHIPSLYRLKKVLGSLVGGYDSSRFQASNITFGFASDQTKDLTVGLQGYQHQHNEIFIDPSIAELWLPVDVCQIFDAAFGLVFDSSAGLYLNPTATFKIGNIATSRGTTSIDIPYASFDLQSAYPYVKAISARYLPLRKVANSTQYVLGRAFFQESTLIVDYESKNFSVNSNSSALEQIILIPPRNQPSIVVLGTPLTGISLKITLSIRVPSDTFSTSLLVR